MIVLEQVSLALGEFSLQDVNLRISKGEYLVLLGPSGAGKTVLLEVIAGLRIPEPVPSPSMNGTLGAFFQNIVVRRLYIRIIHFSLI